MTVITRDPRVKYQRVMLKLSGEQLGGNQGFGIDGDSLERIAEEVARVHALGVQVAIVIGGGNIFRGSAAAKWGMDRASADYMGMLATVINGLALQAMLENKCNLQTRVMTAITMTELAEPYIRRRAIKHLESNRVVIFAGGTGNPLFTTDTAASLRAREIGADVILKATKVDGIYDSDPAKNPSAKKYDELTYLDVISKRLDVMDMTAITMCMEAKLPIIVCRMGEPNCIVDVVTGTKFGTLVQ